MINNLHKFVPPFTLYLNIENAQIQHENMLKRPILNKLLNKYYTKILEVNLFAFAYRLFRININI